MRLIRDQSVPASGVLVPTMGALHEGHAALIRRAAELGPCIVSIFVNPTQFNQPSDFERYPRTLDADMELCRAAGAGVVFAPDASVVYPPGHDVPVPPLPPVATEPRLEDAFRPGHFAGVCQVVMRLFELTRPVAAVFGEKDWQQLRVVTAIAPPTIRIIPHPTLRDADGLALSSRNRFLSTSERAAALAIPRALQTTAQPRDHQAARKQMTQDLEAAGLRVEYAAIRDAASLGPIGRGPTRALIAAWSGTTRLIDNAPWPV